VSERALAVDLENMFLDITSCAMSILRKAEGSLSGH
jgi:hypothetical protein